MSTECLRCGNCCDGKGWVLFTVNEHRALGERGHLLQRIENNGDIPYYSTRFGLCPWFTAERTCGIYDLRPTHCRIFEPGCDVARQRGCKA